MTEPTALRAPRIVREPLRLQDPFELRDLAPAQLREARLVRAFRDGMARRGVEGLQVFTADSSVFLCLPCLEEAVAALGYELEPQEPLPGEEGVFEGYRTMSWHFAREREEDPTSPEEARFYAVSHHGLYRLVAPEGEARWLWLYDEEGSITALVAAREREDYRALIGAAHAAHGAHSRRSLDRLILVGNHGEGRARKTAVTWEDLVLPDALAAELQRTVEEFFAAAPLYRRHGLPHRRGILLAGPPGNGKTTVLKAIGHAAGVPVVVAALDDPSSVHNTRNAFARAADLAPAVLCFEDLDALVGDGPGLSQFLNQLDGLEPLEGVLVVATTNRPDAIDPAIAKRPSRFDRVFVIPDPEEEQRVRYLARLFGDDAPVSEVARVAAETSGYSMAFLKELALQARLAALRRGAETLVAADLDLALAATREHLSLATRGLETRGNVGF